ncbi:MAG TPA: nucleotide 5'-monophosphate nucleosidase PpnN [Rhodocyclaceae bacterium]
MERNIEVVDAQVAPTGRMEILSRREATKLLDRGHSGLHELYRNCSLAVLSCGNELDDGKELLERYRSFDIRIIQRQRGIKLDIQNAPSTAFVDGILIKGIQEHLFAVLRDVVYVGSEISGNPRFDVATADGITDAVFHILRNAGVLKPVTQTNVVVCWGGHSISREEYDYTKEVGYQLGLRGFDICTGCGPGAMKGPMKGAAIAHSKQRVRGGRYLGFTEPGIIAAEAPNPIVNELVIFPDVEKRLEAFVRAGHGIVVFPGGVGTAEEVLYLLGILLHPDNASMPFPLVFTGPKSAEGYFRSIDAFIGQTLGPQAQSHYKIIIDDPEEVAREMLAGIKQVRSFRKDKRDAYYFNWLLNIDHEFQKPFHPTHERMRNLKLHANQPLHSLAANLRRAFSGVVAGNVKASGIREVEKHGNFELHGDAKLMGLMDELLSSFVAQRRMKLSGKSYRPCYRIVGEPVEG